MKKSSDGTDQTNNCLESEILSESSYPYVNINGLIDMNKATVRKLRARVSKMRS